MFEKKYSMTQEENVFWAREISLITSGSPLTWKVST